MKRFKYGLILLAGVCALLAACSDDETEGVDVVETTRVKEIGYQSAVCVGYVRGVCSERGVCFTDESAPDRVVTLPAPNGGDTFEVTLSGLEKGRDYACWVYARVNGQVVRGETKRFRTLEEGEPYLLAGEAGEVEHTSAMLDGYVFTNGGREILERGFCYGPVEEPTVDDERCETLPIEGGLGRMNAQVNGLTDKTDYFVRIYIRTDEGVSYSPVVGFRTRQYNKPIVSIVGFERRGDRIVVRAKTSVQEAADETLETRCGICVGNTEDYDRGTEYTSPTTTIGEYEVEIAASDNVGYIWAWASNKEGKEISNVATSRASVRLEAAMDIRSRWLSPTFTIENLGIFDADVTAAGVCWSETDPEPTVEGDHKVFKTDETLTPNTYTMPLFFGLKTATAYHVRAYVTNQYGTSYSKTVEITTREDLFDGHIRVGTAGKYLPYMNAWQIICNDHNTGSNNVPVECLSPFFRDEIYGGWIEACSEGYGTVMNGIIYKLTGETDGVLNIDVLFYYRKTVSSGAVQFTSKLTCARNADGTFRFRDFTPASTIDKAKTEKSKEQLRRMFTYFHEHDFYFEWGARDYEFAGSGNKIDTENGPLWLVPVDEPQNYWTFTNKHY